MNQETTTRQQLSGLFGRHLPSLASEWAAKLGAAEGTRYSQLPPERLQEMTRRFLEASLAVLQTGDKTPLTDVNEQLAWLQRAAGFTVDDISVSYPLLRDTLLALIAAQSWEAATHAAAVQSCLIWLDEIALDRAKAYQGFLRREEQTHTVRLEGLNRLAAALSHSLNLDTVLQTAMQIARDLTDAEMCRIYLPDEPCQALNLRTSLGSAAKLDEKFASLPVKGSLAGQAFSSGRLVMLDKQQMLQSPGGQEFHTDDHRTLLHSLPKTFAFVPLLSKNQSRGVMSLIFAEEHHFAEDEQALLVAIGHQVGVAVENAQLYELERRQRQIAETLDEVAKVVNSSLDLDQVLDRVLAELAKVIPYDSAAVVLVEQDATRTMAARGFTDQAAVMTIAVPLAHLPTSRQAIEQRRPMVIPDIEHLTGFLKPSLADLEFAHCVAVIPLVSYDKIVGLLYVISWKPGHYSTQDAEIAFRFAQQAAVAIANARFVDEARRRAEELAVRTRQQQALLSIFPAISSELHLEKLLQRIVEEAVAVIPDAQRGSVIVRQVDGFHFLGAVGYDLAILREIILPPEHLATYRSLANHTVVSIRDLGEWESHYLSQHVKDIFRAQGAEIKMTLSAPIVVEGQIFGYLNLDNVETYDAFGPLSREMAGLFAAQAAVAVANARLHGELEETVRRRTTEIRRQRDRTAAILQSVADGVVVTDLSGKIISTNPVADVWLYHIGDEGRVENQPLIAFVRRLAMQLEGDPPDIIEFPVWEQRLKIPCWRLTNCTHEDCPAHGKEEILCWQTPGAYCLIAQEWSLERLPALQTPACPVRARLQMVSLQAQVAGLREGETVQGAVIVLHDISRQRTLDRLKSQFVSTVSHELRTPLTNIKLYHGLLKRGREEKHQYYMEVMEREIVRLERLIQDILDLSQLEMQDRPPRREIVNVNALLQEKIDIHTLLAESKGLKLHLATMPDPLQVHADPNQLRQVFTNLLTNAINYTPEGGEVWLSSGTWHLDGKGWWKTGSLPHTDLVASRPPEGHWAVVSVRDSGVGIAAEDLPRIFDRFYRGAQIGLETSGSGLGLSIVREILDLHGGHCLVESTLGSGSTFTVLLPLPEPKRVISVLVADDEEQIGRLIRRFLSREGMQIRWVANGQQALEAITAERPDLLILDLGMPVLDGYRVLERLQEQGDTPSLPVLVLSSWAEDKFQRVKHLGATEFLNKPFSGTVLVDVVKRLLARSASSGD